MNTMVTAPQSQAVFDPFAPSSIPPAQTQADLVADPSNFQGANASIGQTVQTLPVADPTGQLAAVATNVVTTDLSTASTSPTATPNANQDATDQDSTDQDLEEALPTQLNDDERLDLLDQAISEVEREASVLDQVVPSAVLASDPLNPPVTRSASQKPETVGSSVASTELGALGQIEYEPSPELPPEVDGFLKRVDDTADKLPQEIVIADGSIQQVAQPHPTQTVIVLPITEEEAGQKVSDVRLSLAWLLEWSNKVIKKFVGKVVYRQTP